MNRRSVAVFGLVALFALTGCASDDWEGRYNELHSDLLDVTVERDKAREDLADSYAEIEATQAQLSQEEQRRLAEQRAAQDATDRALEYAAELERLKKEQRQVALPPSEPRIDPANGVANLRGKGIDADVNDDGDIEIRIPADVTFASGEASLTKSGKAAIRRVAPELTGEYASYQVRVEGHTDNDPLVRTKKKWGDNRGLGAARANAVTRYLEGEFGIDPTRILSVSMGDTDPEVPNTSKANKARNRRVAIIVVMPPAGAMSK